MATHLLVVNPESNRGDTRSKIPHLQALMAKAGIEVDMVLTQEPGHATTLVREMGARYPRIIAAGGDGTIHEIVNGLLEIPESQRPSLAILPMGSGNDFMKTASIPKDYRRAVDVLSNPQLLSFDIAKVVVDDRVHRYVDNNVGIGFDAYVNAESRRITWLRGMAIYLFTAVKAIFEYRHPFVSYRSDNGERSARVLMITVGNGFSSGGGFLLTPDAKIDDGLLDVCCIDSRSRWRMIFDMARTMKGTHLSRPGVHYFRTERMTIESQEGLPVHADGEILAVAAKKIEVEILTKALTLLTSQVHRDTRGRG